MAEWGGGVAPNFSIFAAVTRHDMYRGSQHYNSMGRHGNDGEKSDGTREQRRRHQHPLQLNVTLSYDVPLAGKCGVILARSPYHHLFLTFSTGFGWNPHILCFLFGAHKPPVLPSQAAPTAAADRACSRESLVGNPSHPTIVSSAPESVTQTPTRI